MGEHSINRKLSPHIQSAARQGVIQSGNICVKTKKDDRTSLDFLSLIKSTDFSFVINKQDQKFCSVKMFLIPKSYYPYY